LPKIAGNAVNFMHAAGLQHIGKIAFIKRNSPAALAEYGIFEPPSAFSPARMRLKEAISLT
jgi:hypothetical protein